MVPRATARLAILGGAPVLLPPLAMIKRFAVACALSSCVSLAHGAGLAVEFHHAGFGHFFVTAFPEEVAALDANPASGWSRTGTTFLVETDDTTGAAPVCRFFSATFAPRSSHFYTPYAQECADLKGGATWTYEAIAFYLRLPNADGTCPAGTEVLYRLYNAGRTGAPNHRYTTHPEVFAAFGAKGWIAEGHGVTGAFACAPARPASAPAGDVTGVMELRSEVRTLPAADAAQLVAVTPNTLTFDAAVAIGAGDVFVIDGVGAFRATSVADVEGRRSVGVEEPTVDELFARLELKGTVPLAAGYLSEPSAQPLRHADAAAIVRPRKLAAYASVYKGAPGIVVSWESETYCGTGTETLKPFTISVGLYGNVAIDYSKSRPQDRVSIGTAYIVPSASLKAGCRLEVAPKRIKVGQWRVPVFNGLAFIDIPIFVGFKLETDVTPIVTLAFADAEVAIDTATSGVGWTLRGGAMDTAALTALIAPSVSYAAQASVTADASLRLTTLGSFHLGGLGMRSGPALEVKGTGGVASSLCGTLTMPTEVYYQYRSGRKLEERALYKAEPEIQKTGLGCATPNATWVLTTRTCNTTPQGCAECFASFEFDFKFNSDRSSLDLLSPGTPLIAARLDRPPPATEPPPPARYLGGCSNASLATTFVPACAVTTGLAFAEDYRTATFVATQTFDDGCRAVLEGDARPK